MWEHGAVKTSKSVTVGVLGLVATAVGVGGAHFSVLPPMIGFALWALGGALGLAALVWGIVIKVRSSARGGALAAALGAPPFLAVAVTAAIMAGSAGPGINDITTDPGNPPMFDTTSEHGTYPVDFIEEAAAAYPDVKPLALPIPADAAVKVATEVAKSLGWTVVDPGADGFEAYEISRVFRFRDDIAVRVTSSASGSIVDVRSVSRDGKADFGVNAERIVRFLAAIKKRVI